MNSRNNKTSDPHGLLLNVTHKANLKRTDKNTALSIFSIYYTWRNIKKQYKNNEFRISAPKWNKDLKLPDESYSVPDIQDYFEDILKKHGEKTINPPIRIYMNKLGNRITFKIKTRYYLQFLTPEEMKTLGSTKSKITKNENGDNASNSEINEAVLVQCNNVKNDYQQDSRLLYTLFLINHSVNCYIFHLKILYSEIQNFHILKYGLLIKILNY